MTKQITVSIPQKAAIARGSVQWGDQPVDLEAVLALLTDEERGQIEVSTLCRAEEPACLRAQRADRSYSGRPEMTTVTTPTTNPDDVVTAIRESLATIAIAQERRDRKLTEYVESYLAGSSKYNLSGREGDLERLGQLAIVEAEDTRREKARLADLRTWTEQAIIALDADKPYPPKTPAGKSLSYEQERTRAADEAGLGEEYRAATGRRDAQWQAAKKQQKNALLDWAREYGSNDLRRAIAEGYPLGNTLNDEAVGWAHGLMDGIEGASVLDDPDIGDERTVPAVESYALLDRVIEHIQGLSLPTGCEATVGRIVRLSYTTWVSHNCDDLEYCDDCDDDGEVKTTQKRTGVVVSLSVPWQRNPYQIAIARVE